MPLSRTSRRSLLLTLAVSVLLGAGIAYADEVPEAYLGSYRFVGGNAERTALTTEIDRVADQFGWIKRGIARGRMHSEIFPERRIRFDRSGGTLRIILDDRLPVPCDGARHPVSGANDEEGTGTCTFTRNQVRFDERYGDGRSYHVLQLSEDGSRLRMRIRITHPALPDDVRYRLSFRRN